MTCLSVTYRTAGTDVRGRLALTASKQRKLLETLCPAGSGVEAVLLCTCNRTELYFAGLTTEVALATLADTAGFKSEDLRERVRLYANEPALSHLFRVAGGLRSMVLGEDEILGQVKDAYRTACEAGTVGHELHSVFQAAIACGKRIRTETALSRTPVSISTLAAHEAVRAGRKILIIGATGQIGGAVLKHLRSHAEAEVTITRRSHDDFSTLPHNVAHIIDYDRRYDVLAKMDTLISATTSPHATITKRELAARTRTRPLLLIDLAVPSDIEPDSATLPNITRLALDDFERLAGEGNACRACEAQVAEKIVSAAVDNFLRVRQIRAHRKNASYFPFYIEIGGRRGVVIGGGAVARRKVEKLLPFGSQLTVIAPVIDEAIVALPVTALYRAFRESDLDGAFFAIVATNDPALNARVSELCRARGILCNVVDDPAHSSFIFPALIKTREATVAISTNGTSPGFARFLRERIEKLFKRELRA